MCSACVCCLTFYTPGGRYQWGLIMVISKFFATSLLVAITATSASAASYTFDLQKIGSYHGDGDAGVPDGNVLTLTETGDHGSLTATFTGKYIVDPTYSTDGILSGTVNDANNVERHHNGLGICNLNPYPDPTCIDPYHTVDGLTSTNIGQITDFVEMAFSADSDPVDVTLKSLTFGWVGGVYYYSDVPLINGMFEILVSDLSETSIGAGATLALSGTATGGSGAYGLLGTFAVIPNTSEFTDNLFGIKAGLNGSWKLKSATVEYSVPEIPLPAAGWLMLAGIGSIAAFRRKKT